MRSKTILTNLQDVGTLFQYLYMNESHSIIAYNEINVPLEIKMDSTGQTWMRNLNFGHSPHLRNFGVQEWLEIVDQLKRRPSKDALRLNNHATAWDDICLVVNLNVAVNGGDGL